MAASRYVTSFVKLTQISGTKLTCGNFHRLVTIPQNVVCQPKQISSILLATRLLHYRCYSQKPDETQTTSKPAAASPILGSFQGLGIAGEVLKSQDETEGKKSTLSGQQQQNNSEEDEEAKKKKEAEASWRTMKYTLIFFGVTLSGLSGYIIGTWGAPEKDEDGNVIEDQFSSKPLALQYILRSWNAIMNYSQVSHLCLMKDI